MVIYTNPRLKHDPHEHDFFRNAAFALHLARGRFLDRSLRNADFALHLVRGRFLDRSLAAITGLQRESGASVVVDEGSGAASSGKLTKIRNNKEKYRE